MKYFTDEMTGKIRKGYFSAVYFNRAKEILLKEGNLARVTMQIFQKHEGSVLCGMEEIMELVEVATGFFEGEKWIDKRSELEVAVLKDGEKPAAWETVAHITGPYAYFAHLESIYLGILARRTLVATNIRNCVDAAGDKSVIFFADRFDHFLNQEGDGYAARVGGAAAVCTEAMSKGFGSMPKGTIPHALIAINGGDSVRAAELFGKYYPDEKLIALVDFDNDCVGTSLSAARKLGNKLWGVRLDTSSELIDYSLQIQNSKLKNQNDKRGDLYGVNPKLVRAVREALDKEGFSKVKIVVSGGFHPGKIKKFTGENVPADAYGVGSAIVRGENDFTADIVLVEGKHAAKAGREYNENSKLKIQSSKPKLKT